MHTALRQTVFPEPKIKSMGITKQSHLNVWYNVKASNTLNMKL